MGYVRHTYDSPTPNEEHEVSLEASDIKDLDPKLKEGREDVEALNLFLQL